MASEAKQAVLARHPYARAIVDDGWAIRIPVRFGNMVELQSLHEDSLMEFDSEVDAWSDAARSLLVPSRPAQAP